MQKDTIVVEDRELNWRTTGALKRKCSYERIVPHLSRRSRLCDRKNRVRESLIYTRGTSFCDFSVTSITERQTWKVYWDYLRNEDGVID